MKELSGELLPFAATSSNLDRINHNWPLFAISRIAAHCVHAWWGRGRARLAGGCHCANALVNLARGQRTPSPRARRAPHTPGPIKRLPLQYIYFIIDVAGLRVRVGRRANRIMHFCLFLHSYFIVIGKRIRLAAAASEHNHAFLFII